MPRFYIISDIHGFYDELRKALDDAGFDENNEDHWLIGAGDYLDRGRQPQEVINYLQSLPRKILIKGNHEKLILECLKRGWPESYDFHNGTFQTILDLAPHAMDFDEACNEAYYKVKKFINSMVNYVELKEHIIVHSFIPLVKLDNLPKYYTKNRKYDKMGDWRNATEEEWDEARWGNPFQLADMGMLPDKTLVFGHWSVEHKCAQDEGREEFDENAKFEPYYGNGYIGLDCTTAYSKKCGIVVIEDEFIN